MIKKERKDKVYRHYLNQLEKIYTKRRPRSKKLFKRMEQLLPGGDTRAAMFFSPFPALIQEGAGSRLFDIDGNILIDFNNNYTSLIHGHVDPDITNFALKQLRKGVVHGAPNEHLLELAEIITNRVSSVELIRFCNSGTEATLGAIRAAKAFTKRQGIAKVEGGYHGCHDSVEISITPNLRRAGLLNQPNSLREDESISREIEKEVFVLPFNNIDASINIIKKNRKKLAAVIIEPVMHAAGVIPAKREYLECIRNITSQYKILLIMDEVITFRLSEGGAQKIYSIKPDLTSFGKFIGGGFPIGAFGGRRDIMELFSPKSKRPVFHSGTFNANSITMAAGVATLRKFTPSVIKRINSLGDRLKEDVDNLFLELNLSCQITGMGSLFQIHFSNREIIDYRCAAKAKTELRPLLNLGLINEGIFIPKRGCANISTIISEKDINDFLSALKKFLVFLMPYLEEMAPNLLRKQ